MADATHALVAEACLIGNLGMPAQQVMMMIQSEGIAYFQIEWIPLL